MSDPFSPERKTARLKKQNLFGSGYAGLGVTQLGHRSVPRLWIWAILVGWALLTVPARSRWAVPTLPESPRSTGQEGVGLQPRNSYWYQTSSRVPSPES
jgi:hypothetical protein